MKFLLILALIYGASSCGFSQNFNSLEGNGWIVRDVITNDDKQIINDFLEVELQKRVYRPYFDRIFVIKEELGILSPLKYYEISYQWKDYPIKLSSNKDWILDSLQIENLKNQHRDKSFYHWKFSDFTSFDAIVVERALLDGITNKGAKSIFDKGVIIRLSAPLRIDDNHAFISFISIFNEAGFWPIENCAVLLKKRDGKWVEDSVYYTE